MKQAVGVPSNHGVSVQVSLATARTHQMSVTNWLGDVCSYVCAGPRRDDGRVAAQAT